MSAAPTRPRVVRSQVDPRIEQRRRAVAQTGRLRRRRALVILGSTIGVVAALVALVVSPLFDVDRIEVRGVSSLSADELLEAADVARGDRMIEIDLTEARDGLRSVPGVRSANVERDWPSTIRITVTEEEPVAVLRSGGSEFLVSSTGRVLDAPPGETTGVVPFEVERDDVTGSGPGSEVAEDVLAAALAINRMATPFRSQVASAKLSSSGSLTLALIDDASVRMGPVQDLPAKIGAIESVLARVSPQCRHVIDVREPALVTVSRRPGCESPPVTETTMPESEAIG
jgi:cell division protein FtsQ